MVFVRDKIPCFIEVCQLFNAQFANQTLSPSTVCRIVNMFEETGNVSDLQRSGSPKAATENHILTGIENPHTANTL